MSKVAWGILGTANNGIKRIIPAINAGGRGVVHAIASRTAERAAEVAARFGIERSYGSYQALLDDPVVEAVYIPLPNHLHVLWTVKALDAGKHVLCEKPIGLNAAEAESLLAARDRSGRRVVEAFMVRYHPQWQQLRALLQGGRIGTLRVIQAAFGFTVSDPNNIRMHAKFGGGSLFDVGCYCIATARYLFGQEPNRAIALMQCDPATGIDRTASGLVSFPGGGQLAFTSSFDIAPYQRVVVIGSRGRIEVPLPFNPPKEHGCRLVIDSGKSLDGRSAEYVDFAAVDQYALQCDAVAAEFRQEVAPQFPLEDGIANMRVIDALYRSTRSNGWEGV